MDEIKQASVELGFHVDRYRAVIERIRGQKETIKNQEEIIHNLAHQIKAQNEQSRVSNATSGQGRQETIMVMNELKFKREQMNEKLKQLRLLLVQNNGQLPSEYIEWAKETTKTDTSNQEVVKLRQREEGLLKMIQDTTKELDKLPSNMFGSNRDPYYRSGENFNKNNNSWVQQERQEMTTDLRFAQKHAQELEKQLHEQSVAHARELSDLKFQLAIGQALQFEDQDPFSFR